MLHSICQQIWKTQQWPQDRKRSVFIPIPKKGNVKECSNYCTAAAKSLQSCLTLCDPIDGSLPVSPIPGILQAWTLEWVAISFSNDPTNVDNLISGSSAFSKSSLNIWEFTVHILLKPGLEDFEHYFASVWDERNCVVVWTLFGIAFLWDWNENWPFPVLWPLLSFSNLLAYWVQHFHSIIF